MAESRYAKYDTPEQLSQDASGVPAQAPADASRYAKYDTPTPAPEPPKPQEPSMGFRGWAKAIGEGASLIPGEFRTTLTGAAQGLEGATTPDKFDEMARETMRKRQAFSEKMTAQEGKGFFGSLGPRMVASIPDIGYSAATLPLSFAGSEAGAAAGAPLGPVGSVVGGVVGGIATAYPAMARADEYRNAIQLMDDKNKKLKEAGQPPMSTDEAKKYVGQYRANLKSSGTAEALPESATDLIDVALLKRIPGGGLFKGTLKTLVGLMFSEMPSEALTNMWQSQALKNTPLQSGKVYDFSKPGDYVAAMKDVAPAVLALSGATTATGVGAAYVGQTVKAKKLGISRAELVKRTKEIAAWKVAHPDEELADEEINNHLAGSVTVDGKPIDEAAKAEAQPQAQAQEPAPTTTTTPPLSNQEIQNQVFSKMQAAREAEKSQPKPVQPRPKPAPATTATPTQEVQPSEVPTVSQEHPTTAQEVSNVRPVQEGNAPQQTVAPALVYRANGKPFATEASARRSKTGKGLAATHDVVATEGGFAFKPKEQTTQALPATQVTPKTQQEQAATPTTPEKPQATPATQVAPEKPQAAPATQVTPGKPQAAPATQVTPGKPQAAPAQQVTPIKQQEVANAPQTQQVQEGVPDQHAGTNEVVQGQGVNRGVTPEVSQASSETGGGNRVLGKTQKEEVAALPKLKRGYKRSVFTINNPSYAGNTFIEDVNKKGKTTLLVRDHSGVVKPASKYVTAQVAKSERTAYEGMPFSEEVSTAVDPLIRDIEKKTGQTLEPGTFTEVSAPAGSEKAFAALAKLLNVKIIFFKAVNSPMAFNGAANVSQGIIYINVDAVKPHLVVAGHEVLHLLRHEAPELYMALRDATSDIITTKDKLGYWKKLNKKRSKEGAITVPLAKVEEELIANFFGEQLTSKAFWAKVERRNPQGFAEIIQKILDFLDRIKSAFTGKERADIEHARDVAAEALARYTRRNPEAATAPPLTVTKTGMRFSEDFDPAPTEVPKYLLGAAFGVNLHMSDGKSYSFVRDDLPDAVKKFVSAHELHHAKQDPAWVKKHPALAELAANIFPGFRDPVGLAKTLAASFTPERLNFYVARMTKGASAGVVNVDALVDIINSKATETSNMQFSDILDTATKSAKVNIKASAKILQNALTKHHADILKVTPESVVTEVYKARMPKLVPLSAARSRRTYIRNSLIDTAGMIHQELIDLSGKTIGKNTAEKSIATASFNQMWPNKGLMEQDWVPANGTEASRLKQAERAWSKAGMAESTGKTFEQAYRQSKREFDKLKTAKDQVDPEGRSKLQNAYLKAVDHMGNLREREKNNMQRLIEAATVDNPELRKEELTRLDAAFAGVKGAYWPLYREGEYTLEYTDPTISAPSSGRVVEHFESPFGRTRAEMALVEMGVDPATFKRGKINKDPSARTSIPEAFNKKLIDAVRKSFFTGVDMNDKEAVAAATARGDSAARDMTEIWLRWQPETSALKNSIKRRNVKGHSLEMLRGFLHYSQAHGSRIAQMEEGRKVEDLLAQIESDIKKRKAEGVDVTRELDVLYDMRARENVSKNVHVNKFAQTLGKLTTFWYMTSPSIALVQMSQLGVLTMPKLAVMKFGNKKSLGAAKAGVAITRGIQSAFSRKYTKAAMYSDVTVNSLFDDIQATVTPDNRTPGQELGSPVFTQTEIEEKIKALNLTPEQQKLLALRVAESKVLLDISMSHEVNEINKGGDPTTKQSRVFRGMMSFMRVSEEASRKAAILATFDVSTESGQGFFDAMNNVEEVVKSTLYDYSKEAKGVLLQGSVARVLTTFQTFRIMTAFKMGLLFKQSFKHESREVQVAARKELVGIFGMSAALAGVFGMPLADIMFKVLDAALGDDDEPYDSKEDFKQGLTDRFGSTASDIVTEGPASLLGTAISRRIGFADVFGGGSDMPVRLHGDGAAAWYATQMIGPSYSMVAGWAKGYDQMINKGEYRKGLASVSPKPLKDILNAYGLATEGLKTGRGKRLMTPEQIGTDEIILMALGFNPLKVSNKRATEYALSNMSARVSMRRGKLIRDFIRAYRENDDTDSEREAIMTFTSKWPEYGIGASDFSRAMMSYAKNEAGLDTRSEAIMRRHMEK